MTKKKVTHPAYKGGTKLTSEQVVAIVDRWTQECFCTDDDQIGDFLALLYTIISTQDSTERWSYVIDIESKLLPMSVAVDAAINAVVERRVREATKGGAVN